MGYRVSYCTHEFNDIDIHLRTLRNRQEFYDEDNRAERLGIHESLWSLFGIVWPSSQVLAHHLFNTDFNNKRILEVGCGIGLTSLLLNRLNADITATDYHPEVQHFLDENTRLNDDRKIPFVRTGWEDTKTDLGEFDLIIGSDLLYEDEHAELLSQFIDQHSRKGSQVIIVDPGRGLLNKFSREMTTLGYQHRSEVPDTSTYLDAPYKGKIFIYQR